MPEYKVQALGITRWSYPGRGSGFRKLDDDLAVLRAKLYAPNRLEHRLFLLGASGPSVPQGPDGQGLQTDIPDGGSAAQRLA